MEKTKKQTQESKSTPYNADGRRNFTNLYADANVDHELAQKMRRSSAAIGKNAIWLAMQRRDELFAQKSSAQDPTVHADQADETLLAVIEQDDPAAEEEKQRQEAARQEEEERLREAARQEAERLRQEEEERLKEEARREAERLREEARKRREEQKRQEDEAAKGRGAGEPEPSEAEKEAKRLAEEAKQQEAADKEMDEIKQTAKKRREEAAEKNISLRDQAILIRDHMKKFVRKEDATEFNSFREEDMLDVIETILSKRKPEESDWQTYVDFMRESLSNDPTAVLRAQISGHLTYKYRIGSRTVDTAKDKKKIQYRF